MRGGPAPAPAPAAGKRSSKKAPVRGEKGLDEPEELEKSPLLCQEEASGSCKDDDKATGWGTKPLPQRASLGSRALTFSSSLFAVLVVISVGLLTYTGYEVFHVSKEALLQDIVIRSVHIQAKDTELAVDIQRQDRELLRYNGLKLKSALCSVDVLWEDVKGTLGRLEMQPTVLADGSLFRGLMQSRALPVHHVRDDETGERTIRLTKEYVSLHTVNDDMARALVRRLTREEGKSEITLRCNAQVEAMLWGMVPFGTTQVGGKFSFPVGRAAKTENEKSKLKAASSAVLDGNAAEDNLGTADQPLQQTRQLSSATSLEDHHPESHVLPHVTMKEDQNAHQKRDGYVWIERTSRQEAILAIDLGGLKQALNLQALTAHALDSLTVSIPKLHYVAGQEDVLAFDGNELRTVVDEESNMQYVLPESTADSDVPPAYWNIHTPEIHTDLMRQRLDSEDEIVYSRIHCAGMASEYYSAPSWTGLAGQVDQECTLASPLATAGEVFARDDITSVLLRAMPMHMPGDNNWQEAKVNIIQRLLGVEHRADASLVVVDQHQFAASGRDQPNGQTDTKDRALFSLDDIAGNDNDDDDEFFTVSGPEEQGNSTCVVVDIDGEWNATVCYQHENSTVNADAMLMSRSDGLIADAYTTVLLHNDATKVQSTAWLDESTADSAGMPSFYELEALLSHKHETLMAALLSTTSTGQMYQSTLEALWDTDTNYLRGKGNVLHTEESNWDDPLFNVSANLVYTTDASRTPGGTDGYLDFAVVNSDGSSEVVRTWGNDSFSNDSTIAQTIYSTTMEALCAVEWNVEDNGFAVDAWAMYDNEDEDNNFLANAMAGVSGEDQNAALSIVVGDGSMRSSGGGSSAGNDSWLDDAGSGTTDDGANEFDSEWFALSAATEWSLEKTDEADEDETFSSVSALSIQVDNEAIVNASLHLTAAVDDDCGEGLVTLSFSDDDRFALYQRTLWEDDAGFSLHHWTSVDWKDSAATYGLLSQSKYVIDESTVTSELTLGTLDRWWFNSNGNPSVEWNDQWLDADGHTSWNWNENNDFMRAKGGLTADYEEDQVFNVTGRLLYTTNDQSTPLGTDGYFELALQDTETTKEVHWLGNATDNTSTETMTAHTPEMDAILALAWDDKVVVNDMDIPQELGLWSSFQDYTASVDQAQALYATYSYDTTQEGGDSIATEIQAGETWATQANPLKMEQAPPVVWVLETLMVDASTEWLLEKDSPWDEDETFTSQSALSIEYQEEPVVNGTTTLVGSVDHDLWEGGVTATVREWDDTDNERLHFVSSTMWNDIGGFEVSQFNNIDWRQDSVLATLSSMQYKTDASVTIAVDVGEAEEWWFDENEDAMVYWEGSAPWLDLDGGASWDKRAKDDDHTDETASLSAFLTVDCDAESVVNASVAGIATFDEAMEHGTALLKLRDHDADSDDRLSVNSYTRWTFEEGMYAAQFANAEWESESVFALLSSTEYIIDESAVTSALTVGAVEQWWIRADSRPIVYWNKTWVEAHSGAEWEFSAGDEEEDSSVAASAFFTLDQDEENVANATVSVLGSLDDELEDGRLMLLFEDHDAEHNDRLGVFSQSMWTFDGGFYGSHFTNYEWEQESMLAVHSATEYVIGTSRVSTFLTAGKAEEWWLSQDDKRPSVDWSTTYVDSESSAKWTARETDSGNVVVLGKGGSMLSVDSSQVFNVSGVVFYTDDKRRTPQDTDGFFDLKIQDVEPSTDWYWVQNDTWWWNNGTTSGWWWHETTLTPNFEGALSLAWDRAGDYAESWASLYGLPAFPSPVPSFLWFDVPDSPQQDSDSKYGVHSLWDLDTVRDTLRAFITIGNVHLDQRNPVRHGDAATDVDWRYREMAVDSRTSWSLKRESWLDEDETLVVQSALSAVREDAVVANGTLSLDMSVDDDYCAGDITVAMDEHDPANGDERLSVFSYMVWNDETGFAASQWTNVDWRQESAAAWLSGMEYVTDESFDLVITVGTVHDWGYDWTDSDSTEVPVQMQWDETWLSHGLGTEWDVTVDGEADDAAVFLETTGAMFLIVCDEVAFNLSSAAMYTDQKHRTPQGTEAYFAFNAVEHDRSDNGVNAEYCATVAWDADSRQYMDLWLSMEAPTTDISHAVHAGYEHEPGNTYFTSELTVGEGTRGDKGDPDTTRWQDEYLSASSTTDWEDSLYDDQLNTLIVALTLVAVEYGEDESTQYAIDTVYSDNNLVLEDRYDGAIRSLITEDGNRMRWDFASLPLWEDDGSNNDLFWSRVGAQWESESNYFKGSMFARASQDSTLWLNTSGMIRIDGDDDGDGVESVTMRASDRFDGDEVAYVDAAVRFDGMETFITDIPLGTVSVRVPGVESLNSVLRVDGSEIYSIELGDDDAENTAPRTASPTWSPTVSPTWSPTWSPTRSLGTDAPTAFPSTYPSAYPSTYPSAYPSAHPSAYPSAYPSARPSAYPSAQPSVYPTAQPSVYPTAQPLVYPTAQPSVYPTTHVSAYPSANPSVHPSREPSIAPSVSPTRTHEPTRFGETREPTLAPSALPTPIPVPTQFPSTFPTQIPSSMPTRFPTAQPTTVPTPAPTQIMYPILEFPFTTWALVEEAIVEVEIDRAGTVFCALFTASNNALTASEIEVDATSVTVAKDTPVNITFVGLDPLTSYHGGCFARDSSGRFSTPDRFIQAWYTFNLTTGCCRGLTLDQPSVWMYSGESSTEFKVSLESNPSSDVNISVTLYQDPTDGQCNSSVSAPWQAHGWPTSTSLTAQPSVLEFSSSSTILKGEFVVTASNVNASQCHAIVFAVGGASRAEYDSLSDTIMSVLSVTAEPNPPLMAAAIFDTTGSIITLTFNSDTDRAGETGSFACSAFLTFVGSTDATCQWSSDNVLEITLDSSTSSSLVEVGDSIVLSATTLRAHCTAVPASLCGNWTYSATHSISVDEPTTPVVPVPIISGPEDVSTCDSVEWNAYLSENAGGRDWSSIVWSIGVVGVAEPNFTFNGTEAVSLEPGDLAARQYVVTLTLENFFGRSASASLFVDVSATPQPSVEVVGGTSQTFNAFDDVEVEASGAPPDATTCNVSASSLSFAWELVGDASLTSTSVSPRVFKLPAGELDAGASYQARVTVSMDTNSETISNEAIVSIKIAQSNLVALITNRGATAPVTSDLVLDGSGSYDPDYAALSTQGLSFAWSCLQVSPTFGDDCFDTTGVTLDATNLTVPASLLVANEEWRFTLVVGDEDDAERATGSDTFDITLGEEECPDQDISSTATIHNVGDNVVLTASLSAVHSSASYMTYNWTLASGEFEGDVGLASAVTTSVVGTVASTSGLTILSIDGDYTLPGVTYTLQMAVQSFDSSGNSLDTGCYAPVDVETNRPPTAGSMSFSPAGSATIGDTSINFQASSFSDVHTPFRYRWSTNDGIALRVLSAFSRDTSLEFVWYSLPFPEPSSTNSTDVIIYLTVQDSLGAQTTISDTYALFDEPTDFGSLGDTVATKTADAIRNKDPQAVNEVLGAAGRLKADNCDSSCNTVQFREACSPVVGQCGDCLDGYSGPAGPSSGACNEDASSSASSTSRRELRSLSGACEEATGVNGDCGGGNSTCPRCTLGDMCSVDSDCESGHCDDGSCAIPLRECDNNCSGNGTCTAYDTYTLESVPLSECLVTNTVCRTFCVCNTGSYGEQCSLSSSTFSEQQDFVHNMLVAANTSAQLTDASESRVGIVLGALEDITDKPRLLLWNDLVDVVDLAVDALEYYVDNDGYTTTIAESAIVVASNVLTRVAEEVLFEGTTLEEIADDNEELMLSLQALTSVASSAMQETMLLGESADNVEFDMLLGTFHVLSAASGADQALTVPATADQQWYVGLDNTTELTFLEDYLSACDSGNADGVFVFATQSFFSPRPSGGADALGGMALHFGRGDTDAYSAADDDDAVGDGVADVEISMVYTHGAGTEVIVDESTETVSCQTGGGKYNQTVVCPGAGATNETVHCNGTDAYDVTVTCGAVTEGPSCVVYTGDEDGGFDDSLCWQVSETLLVEGGSSGDTYYSLKCRCDLFSDSCRPVKSVFSLFTDSVGVSSAFETAAASVTTATANTVTVTPREDEGSDDVDDDILRGDSKDDSLAAWQIFLLVCAFVAIVAGLYNLVDFVRRHDPSRTSALSAADEQAAARKERAFLEAGNEEEDVECAPRPVHFPTSSTAITRATDGLEADLSGTIGPAGFHPNPVASSPPGPHGAHTASAGAPRVPVSQPEQITLLNLADRKPAAKPPTALASSALVSASGRQKTAHL